MGTTPKTATADAVCPACATGASETTGNCGCNAGTFLSENKKSCTACSPAAAPVANAIYTQCTDATAPTAFTCEAGFWKDGDKCTACAAIANAAVTCTWPGNSQIATCNDKFELKSGACTAVAVVPDAPPTTPAATPAAT